MEDTSPALTYSTKRYCLAGALVASDKKLLHLDWC